MSSTYAAERVQLLQELECGFQIPNASVDAFATGSITSAYFLRDSNIGASQYANRGAVFFRPTTATTADQVRYALSLTSTSGLHTHSGANYTDTTVGTETVEVWYYRIRPDTDVLNAYNRCLSDIYFHAWEPFGSLAADAAMRESGVTSWGTASNTTAAKQTTASRVFPGFIRSMSTTNSGVPHGYLPTANIPVLAGEDVTVIALSRLHSGSASEMTVYDVTNTTTLGSAVTHTGGTWQFSWSSVNATTDCNINVRLGGTGASDVVDWQALWVYRVTASNVIQLPGSYMDENFKLESIAYSPFYRASVNAGTGVYPAHTMSPVEIPSDSYRMDVMQPAANPSFVSLDYGSQYYFQYPLWMQIRLPYSERGTVTAETDTVYAPRHLLMPAWKHRLLEPKVMQERFPGGAQIYAEAKALVDAHSRARATSGPAKRQHDVVYPYMAS